MYSPKISEELIPRIYRAAKNMCIHMTSLVNEILTNAMTEMEGGDGEDSGRDSANNQMADLNNQTKEV